MPARSDSVQLTLQDWRALGRLLKNMYVEDVQGWVMKLRVEGWEGREGG